MQMIDEGRPAGREVANEDRKGMSMPAGFALENSAFLRELSNRNYLIALRYDLTAALKRQMELNARERLNIIISIYGKTGFGKSTVAWILGEWNSAAYGLDYSADWIHFDDGMLLRALEGAGPGEMHSKDEQVEVFGEGSTQVRASLQNIEMTVRDSEISLMYISPEVRLHSHHYIIRPVLKLYRLRPGDFRVLSWVFDGMKVERANFPIGFIITGLPKGTGIDHKAGHHRDRIVWPDEYQRYLKKKRGFIVQARHGDISTGSELFLDEAAESFLNEYEHLDLVTSVRRLKALLRVEKRFGRNFTVGQTDTIAELIMVKASLKGIPLGKDATGRKVLKAGRRAGRKVRGRP